MNEFTNADADVIVVGAGPAGSAVAHHLARAGLDRVIDGTTRIAPAA